MTVELTDQAERLAGMFKALSDPTRLQIVDYLMCCPELRILDGRETLIGATIGQVCCEIAGDARSTKVTPLMSYHTKVLKAAGVIDVERRGRYMVCRINQEAARMIGEFAGSLFACCNEDPKE